MGSDSHLMLKVSDIIQVFSCHADVWVKGEVVKIVDESYVQVEYEIDKQVCRKLLHVHSDHLMITPCSNAIDLNSVLEHDPGMLPVRRMPRRGLQKALAAQSGCTTPSRGILPQPTASHGFPCPSQGKPLMSSHGLTRAAMAAGGLMFLTGRDGAPCLDERDLDYHATEARFALGDFTITFQDGTRGSALDLLDITYVEENAFSCTLNGGLLQGPFEIEYFPKMRVQHPDVVLKIHARPSEDPDDKYRYQEVGFIHTLLHKPGEKVKFTPNCDTYVLGLTIHRGLSKDLQNKMNASEGDKIYIQKLIDRFKQSWAEKGEERVEVIAECADFIISYTGENKTFNDDLLKLLGKEGISFRTPGHHGSLESPFTLCTDRSLGFGVHFHDEETGDVVTLNLGKHGFGQPIAGNGWWGEYKSAFDKTKFGMLVLNPSDEYFTSAACLKEWTMGSEMDENHVDGRIWVLHENEDGSLEIISQSDYLARQGSRVFSAQRRVPFGAQGLTIGDKWFSAQEPHGSPEQWESFRPFPGRKYRTPINQSSDEYVDRRKYRTPIKDFEE